MSVERNIGETRALRHADAEVKRTLDSLDWIPTFVQRGQISLLSTVVKAVWFGECFGVGRSPQNIKISCMSTLAIKIAATQMKSTFADNSELRFSLRKQALFGCRPNSFKNLLRIHARGLLIGFCT
jgi:hypothetical protein